MFKSLSEQVVNTKLKWEVFASLILTIPYELLAISNKNHVEEWLQQFNIQRKRRIIMNHILDTRYSGKKFY